MLYAAGEQLDDEPWQSFEKSILCKRASTFRGAYKSQPHLKPMFFVLENVLGSRQGFYTSDAKGFLVIPKL